jgi:hypothetical protein
LIAIKPTVAIRLPCGVKTPRRDRPSC